MPTKRMAFFIVADLVDDADADEIKRSLAAAMERWSARPSETSWPCEAVVEHVQLPHAPPVRDR